jgi:hypothetical protein
MNTNTFLKNYRYLSLKLLANLTSFLINLVIDIKGVYEVLNNCIIVILIPFAFNKRRSYYELPIIKNIYILPVLFCISEILLNILVATEETRIFIIIRMIYFISFQIIWIYTFVKEGIYFSDRKRFSILINLITVLIPLSILWILLSENKNDETLYVLAMSIAILSTLNFNIILNRRYTNKANYLFGIMGGVFLMSISFFSALYFYIYKEIMILHFTKFMFYNTIIFYTYGIDWNAIEQPKRENQK